MKEGYKDYRKLLEEVEKDIYPLDELEAAVSTLSFASARKELRETSDFTAFLRYIKKKIETSKLNVDEFDEDELERIDNYTKIFHEICNKHDEGKINLDEIRSRPKQSLIDISHVIIQCCKDLHLEQPERDKVSFELHCSKNTVASQLDLENKQDTRKESETSFPHQNFILSPAGPAGMHIVVLKEESDHIF